MPVGLGTAVGYLDLDISGFARGVDSAISDMNGLNGKVKTASQALQTVGGMFTKAGTALTAGFTAPVAGFGAASVKAGTEFDASMSQVAAVSKATIEDLETIRDRAIEMGEKTRYSATEVSDAMYYMGLAGWDAQQIYEGIPGVLALGAASGEDLARVSDIVTDSLTAFGKSAENTTEFVNVLAEATRSSNTTVDQLGEAFKYVGPVAGAFGYSIEDTATILGIFANNGIKGSQAGTGLRQTLNSLINPSEKAAEMMDIYGVSLFNADGSTKSLMTVCEELRGTFGGLAVDIHNADGEIMTGEEIMEKYGHSLPTTEMEKLSAIVKIFGVRALPGMLSVINAADDDFYGLSEAINGAQDAYDGLGTAFGMQETMLDNLQGDWYLFTSALGTTKILISDMAKGALRDLVQKLTELVNKFNEMDPAQREQIIKWALIAASIGPVLITIGKVISGIGTLITTFNTLKGAFNFVSIGVKHVGEAFNLARAGFTGFASETSLLGTALGSITAPMIAIVAVIAALVAAFVNLWKNNEEFRNKIIEIWEQIKAKFEEAGQRIVEIFNELGFNFEDFAELMDATIEWLKIAWDGFCEFLAPIFVGVFDYLRVILSGWIDFFVGVFEVIAGIIKGFKDGDWSLFWKGIGDIVKSVVDTIVGVLDVLGETVWNVIQTVANLLGNDWNMTWDEAKQAVVDWFNSTVQRVSDLVGKIGQFFSNIRQNITTICNNIWSTITTVWNNIVDTIISILEAIVTGVQNDWNNITTIISNFMQLIWDVITSIWNAINMAITNTMNTIYLTIQNVWNTVWKTIRNVMQNIQKSISNIWNTIKKIITTINDVIYTLVNTTWETIKMVLSTIMTVIQNIMTTVWDDIRNTITTITNRIQTVISTVWNVIKNTLSSILTTIQNTIYTVFNAIKTTITNIINAISIFLSNTWNDIKSTISNIVNAIKQIINDVFEDIKTFLTNTWNAIYNMIFNVVNSIKSTITDVFNNIKSTITNIMDAIQTVLTNIWNAIYDIISSILGDIFGINVGVFNDIYSSVTGIVNTLYSSVSGIFDNIKTSMSNAVNTAKQNVISAMQNTRSGMISVFDGIGSIFYGFGVNVIQGLRAGIEEDESALQGTVGGAMNGMLDTAKKSLGINSPSRVFREEIGRWLPPGIAEGFEKAMPAAIRDIENSLNDGIDSIDTNNIDAGNVNLEVQVTDFIDAYKQVFEGLVIWFETMEERMSIAIESLTEYFKYLMYVRQILGNDDEFRTFVFNENGDSKSKKPTNPDMPSTSNSGGGDTYIFNSPKAIDEIQAAKLLKETKRDLAEGF